MAFEHSRVEVARADLGRRLHNSTRICLFLNFSIGLIRCGLAICRDRWHCQRTALRPVLDVKIDVLSHFSVELVVSYGHVLVRTFMREEVRPIRILTLHEARVIVRVAQLRTLLRPLRRYH